MPALSTYVTQARRLLHDPNAQYYQTADLNAFVNLARSHVSREGRCIRVLLSGGTVTGFINLVGGAGYTAATTVTFGGPGVQAFASPVIGGGVITGITLISGGYCYLTAPTPTSADTCGRSGASALSQIVNS